MPVALTSRCLVSRELLCHSQVVVSSLESYFFRSFYASEALTPTSASSRFVSDMRRTAIAHPSAPRAFYALATGSAPVNTGVMSIRPSMQILDDIAHLYGLGQFDVVNGWLDYGEFDFTPSAIPSAPLSSADEVKRSLVTGAPTITPSPRDLFVSPSVARDWSFYAAAADQGMALYYFYLFAPELGGLLPAEHIYTCVIHFLGGRKPWLHTAESITESLQAQQQVDRASDEATSRAAVEWTAATIWWHQLAGKSQSPPLSGSSTPSKRPFALESMANEYSRKEADGERGRFMLPSGHRYCCQEYKGLMLRWADDPLWCSSSIFFPARIFAADGTTMLPTTSRRGEIRTTWSPARLSISHLQSTRSVPETVCRKHTNRDG